MPQVGGGHKWGWVAEKEVWEQSRGLKKQVEAERGRNANTEEELEVDKTPEPSPGSGSGPDAGPCAASTHPTFCLWQVPTSL